MFAARLKSLRVGSGLTQRQLGVLIGLPEEVASTRINRYEKGVHDCDLVTASRIAETLGVPLASLYADRDDLAKAISILSALSEKELEALLESLLADRKDAHE